MIISMTPLAPFFPYFSLAFSPLRTFIDSIVWGLILFKSRSLTMVPSITIKALIFSLGTETNATLSAFTDMGFPFTLVPLETFCAVTVTTLPLIVLLNSKLLESTEMTFTNFDGFSGGDGGLGTDAGGGGGGMSRVATANTFLPVLGSENMVESGWILTRKSVLAAFLAFFACAWI